MKLNLKNWHDRLKLVLLIAFVFVFLALAVYVSTIIRYGSYECPIHRLTGFDCPGCGGTRMVKAILRLDFESAFLFNPYMFMTLPIMTVAMTCEVIRYILKGKINEHLDDVLIVYAIFTLTFGIIRNII